MAAAASVTWQTAQACIQSTVSLLSGCLKNGENVAVVFKDIGVLHIDGLTFHMKFYYDFLEKLSGKEKFRKALLKVSCSFLPPAPGQLLAPCKCCGAVSPPCLGLLVRPVPQPSQGRPTSTMSSSQGACRGGTGRLWDILLMAEALRTGGAQGRES